MRIEKKTATDQRSILIGMITNRVILAKIAAKWDNKEGMFESPWANLIGGWCVKFFNSYDKAPLKSIQSLYSSWAAEHPDPDTARIVEKFLDSLSGEYSRLGKELVPEHIADLAGKYFNKVRVTRLSQTLEGLVENNEAEKADKIITSWSRLELGADGFVDVLGDKAACRDAIETKRDPLVTYPGVLGDFFKDALERDGFIAFQAPEKSQKSFWLIDLSWRAMLQGRRVCYFACGDMSVHQMERRFQSRAARHPLKPRKVKWPTAIVRGEDDKVPTVTWQEKNFKQGLSWKDGWKAFKKIESAGRKGLFRLCHHPAGTLTMASLRATLQTWARQGWLCDVCAIDYADLLAPPHGELDSRNAIDANWKAMRGVSQMFHCLVVTATQSSSSHTKLKHRIALM